MVFLDVCFFEDVFVVKAKLPKQRYEYPDGKPIQINYDYLGNPRGEHPTSGPLESLQAGEMRIQVW